MSAPATELRKADGQVQPKPPQHDGVAPVKVSIETEADGTQYATFRVPLNYSGVKQPRKGKPEASIQMIAEAGTPFNGVASKNLPGYKFRLGLWRAESDDSTPRPQSTVE